MISAKDHLFLIRKHRISHPEGRFETGSRWYPKGSEHLPCCDKIRPPSRNYPNNLNNHCRTKKHISNLPDAFVMSLLPEQLQQLIKDPSSAPLLIHSHNSYVKTYALLLLKTALNPTMKNLNQALTKTYDQQ